MLLSSIRTRLLGLVIATVIPFTALIGAGLWNQWRIDQASAIERALNEARLLAAQVDDHIGNLDNLMMGLSRAVSANPADVLTNDALLQKVKAELPGFVSNVLVFAPDGTNIGTSADPSSRPPLRGAAGLFPASPGRQASRHRRCRSHPFQRPMGHHRRTPDRGCVGTAAGGAGGRHASRAFPGGVARARAAGRQCRPHCR
jgi:hypothetical protein